MASDTSLRQVPLLTLCSEATDHLVVGVVCGSGPWLLSSLLASVTSGPVQVRRHNDWIKHLQLGLLHLVLCRDNVTSGPVQVRSDND